MSDGVERTQSASALPTEDQCVGALVGCAVGDALGAPLEGMSREAIAALDVVAEGRLTEAFLPFREHPPGQYTDDTQMTLALARSIVRAGAVDGETVAEELVRLFSSGEIIGAGPVARRSAERMIDGVDWREAAQDDDLALNGAVMRIGPVGLLDHDHPEALRQDAETSSIVTHRHPDAIAAAVAGAAAVAQAVGFEGVDGRAYLTAVSETVRVVSPDLADRIPMLEECVGLDETQALETIVAGDRAKLRDGGFGVPVLAVPTVLTALYAFLCSPRDYAATVVTALRMGGDVDTVAAIAGAISGARNGVGSIPKHLATGVIDSAEIVELGRALHQVCLTR